MDKKVIIIGAGIGGLTTAAVLSKAGYDVTVLEEQVYAGGCASTFFHKGYRFDAGATLAAGFYPGGPMDLLGKAIGKTSWPIEHDNPAMVVHLPNGNKIACHNGEYRWEEYKDIFGDNSVDFFRWQENTADLLWRFALRLPSWPVRSISDGLSIIKSLDAKLLLASPQLLSNAFRPIYGHLKNNPDHLRLYIDGQLLISAQTTSKFANALYAASALDLPRRGVVHFSRGIGTLAEILVKSIREHGGKVIFRQKVTNLKLAPNGRYITQTKKNEAFDADIIVANLTPWNIMEIMGDDKPKILRTLKNFSKDHWGAFMLYIGVDTNAIPAGCPLHHQILIGEPLGEGNSIFLSISPEWDSQRAPGNQRALTISTHTLLDNWWNLHDNDIEEYNQKKIFMTEKIIGRLEIILPRLRESINLILPGTPITFQRYTGRKMGWVGGFPQTNLFRNFHPKIDKNLFVVGDSIFPGQSTAAVVLGGLRVAGMINQE